MGESVRGGGGGGVREKLSGPETEEAQAGEETPAEHSKGCLSHTTLGPSV